MLWEKSGNTIDTPKKQFPSFSLFYSPPHKLIALEPVGNRVVLYLQFRHGQVGSSTVYKYFGKAPIGTYPNIAFRIFFYGIYDIIGQSIPFSNKIKILVY